MNPKTDIGFKMNIKRLTRAAGDVLLPRVCVVCGCRLNLEERYLCLGCLADMPLTRFWERSHNPMADKFNEKIQGRIEAEGGQGTSEEEEGGRERYAYAAALFIYHSDANYRHIPYQIKYQGDTSIGKYFGRMLGRKLTGNLWEDVDMVIPVPLHWARRWKRGYNQAEVIAGAVAEAMGVPMRSDILERRRRTKTQIKLSIEEKARNVDGAFAVRREKVRKRMGPSCLDKIHHIVVVDDVFTTGSTLAACFSALREIFPHSVRISAVTLGYLER